MSHASSAEADYQQHAADGFMMLALWAENESSQAPSDEELMTWAERYGHTFPVLSDPGWGISNRYEKDYGIPTFSLIGRDMTLRIVDGNVTPSAIEEALAEPVPDVPWNEPPDLSGAPEDDGGDDAPVGASPFATGGESAGGAPDADAVASPFGGGAGCDSAPRGATGGLGALLLALALRRRS